jgi:hypothetical protein
MPTIASATAGGDPYRAVGSTSRIRGRVQPRLGDITHSDWFAHMWQIVCRDVWALHLELLRDPVPAEPYQSQLDGIGEENNEAGRTSRRADRDPAASGDQRSGSRDVAAQNDGEDHQGTPSSDSDSDLNEHEMAQLMKENSDLSSSEISDEDEEGEDSAAGDSANSAADRKKTRRGRKRGEGTGSRQWHRFYESPPSTIAVLMVACWILRIPCLYRDFARCVWIFVIIVVEEKFTSGTCYL